MIGSKNNILLFYAFTLLCVFNISAQKSHRSILTPKELNNNILVPGDIVEIRSGEYKNTTINIKGAGTANKPIHVKAINAGDVIFTGNSRIVIQGDYLIVSDLYFSGSKGKKNKEHYPVVRFSGSNCRFNNSVINDYNNNEGTYWIEFKEGKFNRVDHCLFLNKITESPLIQVWTDENYPNYHRIDHNYFGYRAPLGKNGGELIRIGFSHQMDNISRTIVESNLFEDFQGEIEIISNKSCENIFRNNTFRRCEGQLTLRHGDRCVVESNFFIGQNNENTRGVRIIGSHNIILNNFFEGLSKPAVVFPFGKDYDSHEITYNPQSTNNLLLYNCFVNLNSACFTTGLPYTDLGHDIAPSNISILHNSFINDKHKHIFDRNTKIHNLVFKENTITSTYIQDSIGFFELNTNYVIHKAKKESSILNYESLINKIEKDPELKKRKAMFYYLFSQEYHFIGQSNEHPYVENNPIGIDTTPLEMNNVGPKVGPVWLKDAKPQNVTFINKVYPNPFKKQINFEIQVFKSAKAELTIHTMHGFLLEIVIDKNLEPGIHTITWTPAAFGSQMFIVSLYMDGNLACQRKIHYLSH